MSIREKIQRVVSQIVRHAISLKNHGVTFAKRRPYITAVSSAVLVIVLYVGISALFSHPSLIPEKTPLRTVTLINVDDFSRALPPIPVIGTIRSGTEATILAEASGRITRVTGKLGAYVSAGTVIGEIENSGEYASVLQAQGALDAALAAASKVTGGTREEQRSILETTLDSAEESLISSKQTAITTLLSAYTSVDDALRGKTDQFFTNPTSNPEFTVTTSDSSLVSDVENERRLLETIRTQEQQRKSQLSINTSLPNELASANTELRQVRSYLDNVVEALNKAIPSTSVSQTTIDTYQTTAETARAGIISAITSLTSVEELLNAKTSARDIAKKNLEQGITGGQPQDVQAAEASIAQAKAGLRSAEARYQKTLIRAPFAGTINSLSLDLGEFIQVGTPAVTIANNNLLEVRTAVTEADLIYITTGTTVKINDVFTGTITSKAPALDPQTKKAEVRIAITDTRAGITNGQSVTISIPRSATTTLSTDAPLTLPLSALKFTPDGSFVFTVDSQNTLVGHSVTAGTLLGERIEIRSGLTPLMTVVEDARGLREGDIVIIE